MLFSRALGNPALSGESRQSRGGGHVSIIKITEYTAAPVLRQISLSYTEQKHHQVIYIRHMRSPHYDSHFLPNQEPDQMLSHQIIPLALHQYASLQDNRICLDNVCLFAAKSTCYGVLPNNAKRREWEIVVLPDKF